MVLESEQHTNTYNGPRPSNRAWDSNANRKKEGQESSQTPTTSGFARSGLLFVHVVEDVGVYGYTGYTVG